MFKIMVKTIVLNVSAFSITKLMHPWINIQKLRNMPNQMITMLAVKIFISGINSSASAMLEFVKLWTTLWFNKLVLV